MRDCDSPWANCGNGQCCGDAYWISGSQTGCIPRWTGDCTSDSDCCYPGYCELYNEYGICQYDPDKIPAPTSSSPTLLTTSLPTLDPTSDPTQEATTSDDSFSCTENYVSSYSAHLYMEDITYVVSSNPYVLSVIASGGAAGSGDVVSEGQAYGLLSSAIAFAALDETDPDRETLMDRFDGYFNGWKTMCINSSAPCQSTKYCDGGTVACLPGWKFNADLTSQVGSGSSPDADADAILAMIIAIKAVEKDSTLPSWYDDVNDWADRSITQFLADDTVLSSSGSHRLVKLGSCWGGWEHNGNNPSYHSPGAYRAMRDFHLSYGSRSYALPNFGDGLTLEERWNMLIETSYKFFETTQCPDTGLVPNWARVKEVDSNTLAKEPGSFSGSGTPQKEFGSEASRTIWRVALDALLYPDESASAAAFLEPLHQKLYDGFDSNNLPNWEDNTVSERFLKSYVL